MDKHTEKTAAATTACEPTATTTVTPDQIADWKRKYGEVYVASSEGRTAYLRRPDRKIISAAAVLGGSDNLKQKEILIRNCWLGGDEEMLAEDKYFLGLSTQIDALIEVAQVELKKA